MNSDVKVCECVATEDDWLEISYSQRHYIEEEKKAMPKIKRGVSFNGLGIWLTRAIVLVLVVGVLVAMRFVDSGFVGDIFDTVKQAYASDITQAFGIKSGDTINLPINVTVEGVEDGTVTISGGKVLLNFKKGEVKDVTDTSVTVQVDDKLQIVYSGLSRVMVVVGDKLADQSVIGKYANSATVNLIYDGEVVKDITTVNYTLVWKV